MEAGGVELRVRYAETDQMGRAHHMHYAAWCELGRTELMRAHGISYAAWERRGVRLPVTRLEIDYRRGVGYDERVRVATRVVEVRSRSVSFAYRLTRARDGELVARAETRLVSTDPAGRPVRLPDELRSALEAVAGEGHDPKREGA